jgi:hypothetical protein
LKVQLSTDQYLWLQKEGFNKPRYRKFWLCFLWPKPKPPQLIFCCCGCSNTIVYYVSALNPATHWTGLGAVLFLSFLLNQGNHFLRHSRNLKMAARPSQMKIPVFKWTKRGNQKGYVRLKLHFSFITFLRKEVQVYSMNLEEPM